MGSEAGPSRKRIAYLGPEGTYGQQATRAFIDNYLEEDDLEYITCPTISRAYEEETEYTVLPLENTIYGPVIETLDCFFGRSSLSSNSSGSESEGQSERESKSKSEGKSKNEGKRSGSNVNGATSSVSGVKRSSKGKGKEKEIIATLDLPIRHCLVVKRGVKMEDIRVVSSHEQALGQSTSFLNTYLPNAKRIPVASTALAAESLLSGSPGDSSGSQEQEEEGRIPRKPGRAAICSISVIDIYPELEVLYEGTQDRSDNFTRFILLRSPAPFASAPSKGKPTSHFYLLDDPNRIPTLLRNTPSVSIGSLHTKPILASGERVYPQGVFIELKYTGDGLLERAEGEGVVYLGSGPVVRLDG